MVDLGKTKSIEIVDDEYTVMPCNCRKGDFYKSTIGRKVPHRGWDLVASEGTPINAARRGEVVFADWHDGYGNTVVLRHSNNRLSVYAHLQDNSLMVKVGQKLNAGDILGRMGNTGKWSHGVHLHYQIMESTTKPIVDMRVHIQSSRTLNPFSNW